MFRIITIAALIALYLGTGTVTVSAQTMPTIKFESVAREFYIGRTRQEISTNQKLIKQLQVLPINDEDMRSELARRYNELGPAYLYHLAERTFAIDQQAAVEWYWLGHVRARLDAVLCADSTAAQGVAYLPGAAPTVAAHIRNNPAQAGEIGLKVLTRDDLYDSKASPMWICSHGIKSMNRAIQSELRKNMTKAERDELGLPPMDERRQAPLAWLIPEAKMKAVYSKILDGSRRMFEKLMEPMEEQVQKFTMAAQPQMILKGKNIENALWSGNDRIYFAEMVPREPWNILRRDGTKIETLANDVGNMRICASGDFISYRIRAPRPPKGAPKPKYDPKAPKTLRFKEGSAGAFKQHTIEYTERTIGPSAYQSYGGGRLTFSLLRQSPLTCQWRRMDDLVHGGDYAGFTTDLGRGRGFLASYGGREGVEGGTFYFKNIEAQPAKISEKYFPIQCMKELPFKNAIQLGACASSFVSSRGQEISGTNANVALLSFDADLPKIQNQPFDLIPGERGNVLALMTKRGIVRVMQSRVTSVGAKPGGLYWYQGTMPLKIWEGYPKIADVSDDGCKIVFTEGKGASRRQNVYTLDICKALPA